MRIDHVYVLSLSDKVFSQKRCRFQLQKHGITDFTIFDAVDGRLPGYDDLYARIAAGMDEDFRRHNFSRGALGCLLSHLEILRDALVNRRKNILVLEDDFLLCHDFASRLRDVVDRLPARWDLVYLGKKQGRPDEPFHRHPRVHHDARFAEPVGIDDFFYRPSHRTWGSHALLLHETVFRAILRAGSEYFAPIDLVLISLYDRHVFLAVRKDLVITDESESTILQKPQRTWDGWTGEYGCREMRRPRRVFIVGSNFHHTHTYIHEMYKKYLEYYYPHLEVTLTKTNDYLRYPGSIVLCSPAHFPEKMVFRDTHLYIIHLDSDGDDKDFLEKYKKSQRLENKDYIVLLCREGITDLDYFGLDVARRVLCLPWFCDRLYHEIAQPQDVWSRKDGWLLFFGSVWSINYEEILGLVRVVKKNGWRLVIKGRIFGISEDQRRRFMGALDDSVRFECFVYKIGHERENSLASVLERFPVRAILPIQGSFHHASYLSNRIFECLSNGFLILTNNPFVRQKFGSVVYDNDLERLLTAHEELLLDKTRWLAVFEAQKKEYLEKFYGFLHIERLFSFFQQATDDKFILLEPEKEARCEITFTRSSVNAVTNETIRALLVEPRDVVVGDNDLSRIDPFLLRRLASLAHYGNRVRVEPSCAKKAYIRSILTDSGIEIMTQNYFQFFLSRNAS